MHDGGRGIDSMGRLALVYPCCGPVHSEARFGPLRDQARRRNANTGWNRTIRETNLRSARGRTSVCVLLLIGISAALFAVTLELRRSWVTPARGVEADGENVALIVGRNWYREGFFHLRGGIFLEPASVELPDLEMRNLYVSYPAGTMLPIYLFSNIVRREPTPEIMRCSRLANHFLATLALTFLVFTIARQIRYGHRDAFLFALSPIVLELFTPAPLVAFAVGLYSVDVAVLLPCALYFFLEVLRDSVRDRRWLFWCVAFVQGFVAFLGILTEWIFGFIAACVYVKRLVRGELGKHPGIIVRRSIAFGGPFGLGLALFLGQCYSFHRFGDLVERFTMMSGMRENVYSGPSVVFWVMHIVRGFGIAGAVILGVVFASLVIALICTGIARIKGKRLNEDAAKTLAASFVVLFPSVLFFAVFRVHIGFPFHFFTIFNISAAFATVPFALFPMLLASVWLPATRSAAGQKGAASVLRNPASEASEEHPAVHPPGLALPMTMFGLAAAYLVFGAPDVYPEISGEPGNPAVVAAAKFIGVNTGYEDIVFTNDPALGTISSGRYISYSMKEVYPAASIEVIYSQVKDIQADYVVNLLLSSDMPLLQNSNLRTILARASTHRVSGKFSLDGMRKADFLAMCKELGVE